MKKIKLQRKNKEKFFSQSKKQRYIIIFSAAIFISIFLALIISAIYTAMNGGYFFVGCSVFHQNVEDAFMDFFNVNYFVLYMDPYIGSDSSYPPMVLLFAKIFQIMCGGGYSSSLELRVSLRGILSFILFLGIFFVLAWMLLRTYLKQKDIPLIHSIVLYVALIFTAPVLYAIDRGNCLIYAFLFVGYFLLYYKSEKRWQRELSYLALALAVSFKIYPAVFAVLLLNKKDWAGFNKTVAYSIVMLILPIFAFEGSFAANFSNFISNLLYFQSQSDGYYIGNEYYVNGYYNNISIVGIVKIFSSLFSGTAIDELPESIGTTANLVAIIFAIISVVGVFFAKKEWVKVFLLTSVMTFVLNTNYQYSLIFFIFPLLMFFMEDDVLKEKECENKRMNVVYYILFLLIFIPLPLGYLIPKGMYHLEHGYPVINLIEFVAYISLTIVLVVQSFMFFIKKYRLKEKNAEGAEKVTADFNYKE